ncbi:MAG: hypothetical protein JXB29_00710 [Sedimentisphaerales bacterium]|nr:hypothetical protein [Sedimentisphaerales bacterium]
MKMAEKKIIIFKCLAVLLLSFSCSYGNTVYDHFDNNYLDDAWQVMFKKADGWTYSESGTLLTATGIEVGEPDTWSGVHVWQINK